MRKWDDYKKTMEAPISLWQAAKDNDLDQISSLVAKGADVNEKDHRGYSPLMLAVYSGNQEASSRLISLGADTNSADFAGNSILMGASFKGYLPLVELLVSSGANPNTKNAAGMTAQDFAVTFGRKDVANFLARKTGTIRRMSRLVGFFKIVTSRLQQSQTQNSSSGGSTK